MTNSLSKLVEALQSIRNRMPLADLVARLENDDFLADDVLEWGDFSSSGFTRCAISESPFYSLYVMRWEPGQESAIHDHRDSSCAVRVLSGCATEVCYEAISDTQVVPTSTRELEAGAVFGSEDLEIHKVVNACGGRLVTLHIYSPPLRMRIYEQAERAVYA